MFDTLHYTKKLEQAGISREQAEVHIQIMAEIVEGNLATKQDLRDLEQRLFIKTGVLMLTVGTLIVSVLAIIIKN